jgi:multidrug efflux pump subunit AcrA (membrane-fusion protein)
MFRSFWVTYLLMAAPHDPETRGASPPPPPAEVIALRNCTMDFERSTLLGSPIANSVLQDCNVRTGEAVKADQVIGRMRDWDIRAEMNRLEVAAESDFEIRVNESKHTLALARLKMTEDLRRRQAVSLLEHTVNQVDATTTRLEVENAQYRRQLAQLQFEQAKAEARMREIIAPHDGIVAVIFRRPGESCPTNDPIFHIVDTSQLLVTGLVDVSDAWRVHPGQTVRVSPEIGGADLPVEREVFQGRLIYVDRHVDPKTQTCRVVARVANRNDLLLGGLKARMEVIPAESAEAQAVTKGPS